MRKSIALWLVLAVMVLGMSACSTFIEGVATAILEVDDALSGPAQEAGEDGIVIANTFIGMQQTVLFNIAYMQVFAFAGYEPGVDDFEEGQGVTWRITLTDEDDETQLTSERALLRRMDGGSWWFIAYRSDDQELQYEVLLNQEGDPSELVWRDEDSGTVYKYIYDAGDAAMSTAGPDDERFDDEYRRGTRRVTVGAGTFSADYIVYEYTDPNSGDSVEYHWWVVEEVPGDLVKYEYRGTTDDEAQITGELISIDSGYRSVFGVY
jgi:hypothetical protein